MARLRPEDFQYIKGLVGEVETQTTAEIVPLILGESNDYSWVHSVMAFQGMLFGALGGWIWNWAQTWPMPMIEFALVLLGGSVLGLLLSFVPYLARLSIGQRRLGKEVDSRAFSEFVRQGCADTANRTGILVMVSLFERRIEIVADSGVQKKMIALEGPNVWESACKDFAANAAAGKAVEGLANVIRDLAVTLAKHFPDDGSGVNSLSNDLRTGK